MQNGQLEYSAWIDDAMRLIVKRALERVRDHGLPGKHHFFISFITHFDGVSLSDTLRARYPEEMTVVLQHQFSNLKVNDASFSVDLSFDGTRERLEIPFNAIVAFADPSVKFGLQFRRQESPAPRGESGPDAKKNGAHGQDHDESRAGGASLEGKNVISLAKYRNPGQGNPPPSGE